MKRNDPIGIFDSGMGGLTLVRALLDTLPSESLIYLGDTARMPYGPKSLESIRAFSLEICGYLLDQGCKAIVVACNTATAAAINLLRETWPDIPILGMEPAVKPAVAATRSGVIGVLATRATFSSPRYADLMQRFGYEVEILEDPCSGLVELIEVGAVEAAVTEELLRGIVQPMLDKGADTFVLGCTHYPFVRGVIEKIAGPEVQLIDPAPSVAMHLRYRLEKNELENLGGEVPERRFLATGETAQMQLVVSKYLGLLDVVEGVELGS